MREIGDGRLIESEDKFKFTDVMSSKTDFHVKGINVITSGFVQNVPSHAKCCVNQQNKSHGILESQVGFDASLPIISLFS